MQYDGIHYEAPDAYHEEMKADRQYGESALYSARVVRISTNEIVGVLFGDTPEAAQSAACWAAKLMDDATVKAIKLVNAQ